MNELAIKPLGRELLSSLLSRHLPGADPNMRLGYGEPAVESRQSPPFDDRMYWEMFEPGDPDGEAWLSEYLEVADQISDTLRLLLDVEPDADIQRGSIKAAAHRLAGSSLSVGAMRLGDAARAMHHAADGADWAAFQDHRAALLAELVEAKKAIALFIGGLDLAVAT